MIPIENISLTLVMLLFVIGIIIVTFFILFYNFIFPAIRNRRLKRFIRKWIYRLELLTWLSFLIYSIYRLLLASPITTIVFLTLIILLGWNFWRDILQGAILKIDDKVRPGDTISILGEKGMIETMDRRNLTLRTHQGEQMIVHYRKMEGYRIITEQGKENVVRYIISREVVNSFGGAKELKKLIVAWPWASPKHEPQIVPVDEVNIEITVWSTNPGVRENFINYILNEISEDSQRK